LTCTTLPKIQEGALRSAHFFFNNLLGYFAIFLFLFHNLLRYNTYLKMKLDPQGVYEMTKVGRKGITYLDVVKAANELQGNGLNPTVDEVRLRLGTGSKSTIVPHLRQWRRQQNEAESIGVSEYSQELSPPRLLLMLKELFQYLERGIESISVCKALNTEKQKLEKEITLLNEKLHSCESDKLFLVQERVILRDELKKLLGEIC